MQSPTKSDRKRADRPIFLLRRLSRQILLLLVDYPFLRTDDFYDLIEPHDPAKPESHRRNIRRALKDLRDFATPDEDDEKKEDDHDQKQWGYIRSVSWADPRIENKIEYNCLVHTLTDRGLRLVRRKNLDNGNAKSGQEIQNIDHEIGILRYRLALRKWCMANGYILYWTQVGLKTATVSADALYYVYDQKTDTSYGPFFLEYEKQKRGKYDDDGKPQVIRKLVQFDKYYGSDQCMKDFKFRQFYVTTVLRTERKRKFLLQDLAENGCKKLRFWLTTEDLALQNIGGQIFQTPKDHQRQTYSLLSE